MTIKECYDAMGADYNDVVSRLRTDDRIKRFLFMILKDTSYDLLCNSLADKNMEDAFRAAHTIKGICQNLSLTALLKTASALTEVLRNKTEYSSDIEPCFESLKNAYAKTVSCINELQNTQE